MSKTWNSKQELMNYIQENYITGKVTRQEICDKFGINKNTLNSFLYYHKIKSKPEKVICPNCGCEIKL